jgi:RND superfamily putative drug exporter
MAAMAGMYLTGEAGFMSFGTGTIMVVAVAMLGSITVLPATLAWLGDRIDKGRVPLIGRRRDRGGAGAWGWLLDRVLKRPVVSVVLAGGLLVALAIPAFSMHTVETGAQGLPPDLPIMKTYNRIQAAFPGGPMPADVVVQAKDVTSPAVRDGIRQLTFGALATGYMQEPVDIRVNPDKTVAVVSIALAGNGTDATSERALSFLRDDVIPTTIDKVPGTKSLVTGATAGSLDFTDLMKSRAPWVFAFVLTLAFGLLMVTFRSIVIALKAVVLNLLSVGAAYGVLVLVFQDGRLEGLLDYDSIGGVASWLPLFLFVILFGLSMDYHVFILSRVREAYDRGATTEQAVAKGIKSTASVVTSAAVVMVFVFGIFATLSGLDFKMMGVGLATAVLIDATIVRAVLLPATMKLLGDWNWYLPRWLEWLPRTAHEPSAEAAGESPAELGISVARHDGRVRIALAGELDLLSADAFGARLAEVEAERPELLELDLRGLTFMDSTGLGMLFAANRRAVAEGRRVVLLKGDGPIERVLDLARVEDVIDTVEEPSAS